VREQVSRLFEVTGQIFLDTLVCFWIVNGRTYIFFTEGQQAFPKSNLLLGPSCVQFGLFSALPEYIITVNRGSLTNNTFNVKNKIRRIIEICCYKVWNIRNLSYLELCLEMNQQVINFI